MRKRIHIVSFDVPYPADYGGVIDVFSRIKWFAENGFEVILHCFEYKRPKAPELEKYAKVYYYKRPRGLKYWLSKLPFIVNTRINSELEKTLRETTDEVLLEGLHCAHYLNLQPGKFYLRTHNIEHEYYQKLSEKATGIKRIYYRSEAKKLKKYESILSKAKGLLVISPNELAHFKVINPNSTLVPSVFESKSQYQETEPYVLFHGNLSVEENEAAVSWIIREVKPQLENIEVIIAGKNPSVELAEECSKADISLIENPSETEMESVLQKARIHLLHTNNSSGLKLKFVHAMLSSGHVICSPEMVLGSGIKVGFHSFNKSSEAVTLIHELIRIRMSKIDFDKRLKSIEAISGANKLSQIFLITK